MFHLHGDIYLFSCKIKKKSTSSRANLSYREKILLLSKNSYTQTYSCHPNFCHFKYYHLFSEKNEQIIYYIPLKIYHTLHGNNQLYMSFPSF